MSCLIFQMNESSHSRRSFKDHITTNSSPSTSNSSLPESLVVGAGSLAPRLKDDSGNHDLSPTPIDPSRINVVDHVPFDSFKTKDETSLDMLISLLTGSLPHRSHHYVSRPSLPQPSHPAGEKVEHSIRTSHEIPLGVGQRRPIASIKEDPSAKKAPAGKRPHSAVTSAATSSIRKSPTELEPTSQHKKTRSRALKSGQWFEKLNELAEYRRSFGHCHVPHNWKQNVALAQWVKRQRYQFKLRQQGKHSTLTEERMNLLNDLEFVWSSHGAIWEERLEELQRYATEHGNCNVPKDYPENKGLAVWVKCQRRQYKLFLREKEGTMTLHRIQKLNQIGFVWDPRKADRKLKAAGSSASDDDEDDEEVDDESIGSTRTIQYK